MKFIFWVPEISEFRNCIQFYLLCSGVNLYHLEFFVPIRARGIKK